MKERWALYKTNRNGLHEVFWTGRVNPSGSPQESVYETRAFVLSSKELAYLSAEEHSMWTWKVCNLDDRLYDRKEWKKKRILKGLEAVRK